MNGSFVRIGFLVLAGALAVVSFAGGILYLTCQLTVDTGGAAMQHGVGTALVIAGLALSAGLWASRHSNNSGGSLIAAGAVPTAICFWWTGVVPAVALPVAAIGIVRARRQARIRKATP